MLSMTWRTLAKVREVIGTVHDEKPQDVLTLGMGTYGPTSGDLTIQVNDAA